MIGHRPTNAQKMLADATATLKPEQSFARIETYAKYLIASTTLITTLLGGFGIFTASNLFTRHPSAIYLTLTIFGISFALAIYALIPLIGDVNIDNLDDVSRFFGVRLRLRGAAVWLAGLAFALGLMSIAPAIISANRRDTFAFTASAVRNTTGVTVKIALKSPPDAQTEVKLTGKTGNEDVVLFESTDPQVTETISTLGAIDTFTASANLNGTVKAYTLKAPKESKESKELKAPKEP